MRADGARAVIDVFVLRQMLGRLVREVGKKPRRRRCAPPLTRWTGCSRWATCGRRLLRVRARHGGGQGFARRAGVARAFRGHVPRVDDDPHGTETRDSAGLLRDRRRRGPLFAETRPRGGATARARGGDGRQARRALALRRRAPALGDTASAAPPNGLFFAGVGYGDHPEHDEAYDDGATGDYVTRID